MHYTSCSHVKLTYQHVIHVRGAGNITKASDTWGFSVHMKVHSGTHCVLY